MAWPSLMDTSSGPSQASGSARTSRPIGIAKPAFIQGLIRSTLPRDRFQNASEPFLYLVQQRNLLQAHAHFQVSHQFVPQEIAALSPAPNVKPRPEEWADRLSLIHAAARWPSSRPGARAPARPCDPLPAWPRRTAGPSAGVAPPHRSVPGPPVRRPAAVPAGVGW